MTGTKQYSNVKVKNFLTFSFYLLKSCYYCYYNLGCCAVMLRSFFYVEASLRIVAKLCSCLKSAKLKFLTRIIEDKKKLLNS